MILFDAKRRQVGSLKQLPRRRNAKRSGRARRERLWMASVYVSSFIFIAMVTAEFIYAKSKSALPPSTEVTFINGQVAIPLATVSDGDLHRFPARENGTEVRFWLYQKPDGKIATVFDACEICGPRASTKTANGVVCKNCGAPINPQSVGKHGRLQSGPAESDANGRRCDHRGGGCGGPQPPVRTAITNVRAPGLRILPAANAAQVAGRRCHHAGRHCRDRHDRSGHGYRRQNQPRVAKLWRESGGSRLRMKRSM